MKQLFNRRSLLAGTVGSGFLAGASLAKSNTVLGANDSLRLGMIGLRQQGLVNMLDFCRVPGVEIVALCDVDESQFEKSLRSLEGLGRKKPLLFQDLRKMLERKDIDAVSIATPNHWHALATVWACQAGKDVHVEKPGSHNIYEGRKMVEAAERYGRIVQHGTEQRSSEVQQAGIRFLREGGIGEVYMAKGICYKWRDTIAHTEEEAVPPGVNYDLWLGPAPKRPFSRNRFHYNWHWNWDYGNGDIGNQGVHEIDVARWGLGVSLPTRITSVGNHFMFQDDQQTPNWQMALFEFPETIASGDRNKILQFEVRPWITNHEGGFGQGADNEIGNFFYGTKGYMTMTVDGWNSYLGKERTPGQSMKGPGNVAYASAHAANFIAALRKRDNSVHQGDLQEGHYTCALIHLANASCRLRRNLLFDPKQEICPGDQEANKLLTRNYRPPFVL